MQTAPASSIRVLGNQQLLHQPSPHVWVVVKIMVPFLGTLNTRCHIIIGTQKGTIILTSTHMCDLAEMLTWPALFTVSLVATIFEAAVMHGCWPRCGFGRHLHLW